MTSTNPLHEPPGPPPTERDTRTLGSVTLLVAAILLAFVGVLLAMFGIAPALVLVVIAAGLGFWSRHAAKRAGSA